MRTLGKLTPTKTDRNLAMCRAVLCDGKTFAEMAKVHGISTARARDIVHKTCKKADSELYGLMTIVKLGSVARPMPSLDDLRRCAHKFISKE